VTRLRARARRVAVAAAGLAVAGAVVLPTGTASPSTQQASLTDVAVDPTRATVTGLYLVTLVQPPSAAYAGGVAGLAPTRPKPGERFDRTRPEVVAYERHLRSQQDRLLGRIGDPATIYRYTTAANGFAAQLTDKQVKRLRGTEGVALVERSTTQHLDVATSPDFLGLTGPRGVWSRLGGPDRAGRGTVVGVIDSGIWPENPSFADLPLQAPDRVGALPGFHGSCRAGEQWNAGDCNAKVISARHYVAGFGRQRVAQAEYLSPRDSSGHGSHTASVAAGNNAVDVAVDGQELGKASGVAPGARIAVYKACWTAPNPDDDGCTTADTVAAVDDAVADGVDVINYSISGDHLSVADTVSLAFLRAAGAGVFVATSAGNGGPEPGTVAHPSPWVTTVGASSHHLPQGAVVLGDGTSYVGAMVADRDVAETSLVLSADVPAAGASQDSARLCEIGSLDAAAVEGSIVVCDRGVIARVDKSRAVARAGGVGMVLVNTVPDSIDADFHDVPTVHLDQADGSAVREYVAEQGEDATALIDADGDEEVAVPQVAGFSSRGPSPAADGDLLKPDLTAPGIGVLGAVAPPSNSERLWDVYSGTSTSAPHVAGLAALVASERPEWSPARIKSALMTTADDLERNDAPFAQGAGHVDPEDMLDPVLVYGAGPRDWLGFLIGSGFEYADGSPVSRAPVEASDLNLPSIAVGDLTGSAEVTRTVTNVSDSPETFEAGVVGLDGVAVSVEPAQILLRPGESETFTVRFETLADAQPGTFTTGSLTWTGLTGEVRIPVAVRPRVVAAPREVRTDLTTGSVSVRGRSGTDAPVEVSTTGLVGSDPTPVTLVPGSFDAAAPQEDADTLRATIEVPAGTQVARFAMDARNGADDLDVFVYHDDELVGSAATGSADEAVTLTRPEQGRYEVYVNSYSAADGASTSGRLYSWVVGAEDAGNLAVSPEMLAGGAGSRFTLSAAWNPDELDAGRRWFGVLGYADSDRHTFVTVR